MPNSPVPGLDATMVWWATPGMFRPAMMQLLTTGERERCRALRLESDQVRFTLATAVLRLTVSALFELRPLEVDLCRRCSECGDAHGRPTLPGTGWWVSISHSHQRVGVALTRQAEVGLDVEHVRPINLAELANCVLGENEHAATPRDFFVYWTRKESVVKATGHGLLVPLHNVLVSPPAESAHLRSYPHQTAAITVIDLCSVGPYAAALAVRDAAPPDVTQRSAARLLRDWTQ